MRVAMNWHVDGNPAYLGTAISIESKIELDPRGRCRTAAVFGKHRRIRVGR